MNDYNKKFKKILRKRDIDIFSYTVKAVHMMSRMIHSDSRCFFGHKNSLISNRAAGHYFNINLNSNVIDVIPEGDRYLIDYIFNFFPDIGTINVINEEIKFPYKNLGLVEMKVVHMMDERLDLLRMADEKNMSLAEFYDFIMNWVTLYNMETNNNKYEIKDIDGSIVIERNNETIIRKYPMIEFINKKKLWIKKMKSTVNKEGVKIRSAIKSLSLDKEETL